MIKKTLCVLLLISIAFLPAGCWNYRGINEITIITGIGIDKDMAAGIYHLTFEIVDLTSDIKQTGTRSKIVEAEGKTLFEATRNAKKRLVNKLYFGNTQVIVVSKRIAAEEGIFFIADWFLRDKEFRESVSIVISKQETARDTLLAEGIDDRLVAFEIKKIVDRDRKVTGSTRDTSLYDIFNTVRGEGVSLTVPAFHTVINDGRPAAEVNGLAVFKGDKLLGFLTPEEANRFLFVMDDIRAGVVTVSLEGAGPEDTSLEIAHNKTKRFCSYEDGRAKAVVKSKTEVYLGEIHSEANLLDEQELRKIEAAAAEKLEKDISRLIKKVQAEYDSDIFGFGSTIYKKNPKLWEQISSDWDQLFKDMDVEVQCEVKIVNTASLIKN